MIHDAKVEVTCDGKSCRSWVEIELEYVYQNISPNSGKYNDSDSKIEQSLVDEYGWIVKESKQFCCEECAI